MGQGKAFADMKPEGEINHLIKSVCKKLQKNKSAEVIADQRQVGSYDAEQIYKVYSAGGC